MAGALGSIARRVGRFVLRQYELVLNTSTIGMNSLKGLQRLFSPAGLQIFLRQMYFTSVQPIPIVVAGAFIIGITTVHFVVNFFTSIGAYDEIGRVILIVIVNELSSVFIAVLVMIRSGSAIITELALMKLNNELDTLRSLDVDFYGYLVSPRLLAIVVSNVLLSVLFVLTALLGGFISFGYINNVPFYDYMESMAVASDLFDFVTVYIKSLVFGLVIALTSVRDGLGVKRSISEVPVRLIHGLVVQIMLIVIFVIAYDSLRYGLFI